MRRITLVSLVLSASLFAACGGIGGKKPPQGGGGLTRIVESGELRIGTVASGHRAQYDAPDVSFPHGWESRKCGRTR